MLYLNILFLTLLICVFINSLDTHQILLLIKIIELIIKMF